jgi:hypothetical protein
VGGVGFGVEEVELAGAAVLEDDDAGAFAGGGLGEEGGQGEAAEGEGAEAEEVAALG